LRAESFAGKIIDLIGDKSLTIVSLLYAAERSISLLPLAIIAGREIIMLGARAVVVDGRQLLPTSRFFGGLTATALWGNTLLLICTAEGSKLLQVINHAYWGVALVFGVNLTHRIYVSRGRIRSALSSAG
jgi:phosphatidylglycerophosphate synthase